MKKDIAILIVNFGGPRNLREVEPFLKALLTDQDVIRSDLPSPLHRVLFSRIARKRAEKIEKDYEEIGGGSPIFADTEAVASALEERLDRPVLTFHRYLPKTHKASLEALEALAVKEIVVFPMFPQFTYATTGSIARFLCKNLSEKTLHKLRWVKSYPSHPAFIHLIQNGIHAFLEENNLKEEEMIFLFSAHGLPKKFIAKGDLYQDEVEASVQKVMNAFPKALCKLAYQSKFGPDEWLGPYTIDVCETIRGWHDGRENVLFIPISFTSDHIETLFEIEKIYMPIVSDQGLRPYRLPSFNRSPDWVLAIEEILTDFMPLHTSMLVYKPHS